MPPPCNVRLTCTANTTHLFNRLLIQALARRFQLWLYHFASSIRLYGGIEHRLVKCELIRVDPKGSEIRMARPAISNLSKERRRR